MPLANLKLAFRMLAKAPFLTLVAVVSLALGIGANVAIFSLFDKMLLRPLPVQAPQQLVNLSSPGPKPGSQSCNQAGPCDAVFSYTMFRDLERVGEGVFSGIAAHRTFGANLAYRGQTLNGDGMLVSARYFTVLGLQPALGRLLGPADAETVGGAPVAVLAFDYWRRRFDQDPGGHRADVDRQRPQPDDRRRGPRRIPRNDARVRNPRSSCPSRCAD